MAPRVGPYRILRRIDSGGQGQVFLGYDGRLQRRVAIKIYRLPETQQARRDCLLEARRLAGIRDARVVQVHDLVESRDYVAMVMEYVSGCTLEEVLGAAQLDLAAVLRVAIDLAGGIAAARRQQLVHGDIKAANVLVSREGRALLTDFGIALTARATPGPGRGASLESAAPEQLRGEPLDVRTDLFALGRLLYRLVTGEHPFTRSGQPSLAELVEGEPVAVRAHLPAGAVLPDDLLDLIDQLLCRDPASRPADTHPVRRVLRRLLRAQPVDARSGLLRAARPLFPAPNAEDQSLDVPLELSRKGRSHKARLALRRRLLTLWPDRAPAGALLLGLLATAAVLWVAHGRPQPRLVWIEEPHIETGSAAHLPAAIDRGFLSDLLASTLQHRGGVRLAGDLLPRTRLRLGEDDEMQRVDAETLGLKVRCSDRFCLLSLVRRFDDEVRQAQRMLANDAGPAQWQRALERALDRLFP